MDPSGQVIEQPFFIACSNLSRSAHTDRLGGMKKDNWLRGAYQLEMYTLAFIRMHIEDKLASDDLHHMRLIQ